MVVRAPRTAGRRANALRPRPAPSYDPPVAAEAPLPRSPSLLADVPGHVLALAGLAGTAGVIHVVATVEHLSDEWWLVLFFAVVGAGQLAAAWWLRRRPPERSALALIAAGSAVVALLWIASRTTGIPFGPEAGRISPVGVGDSVATLQELAFVAIAAAVLARPDATARRLSWLAGGMGVRLVFMLLSLMLLTAALGGHEH